MKKFKKLIPAMVMLLIATMLMGTTTYAWFSMNTSVTATGMEVKASVGSNILIATTTLAQTSKEADENFKNEVKVAYTPTLLEPVSTVDGKTFAYTVEAQADGKKLDTATYVKYNAALVPTSGEELSFNTAYGTTGAVGFVDYAFQLKAINTSNSDMKLNLTTLNLAYNGTDTTAQTAFRVAYMVQALGDDSSFVAFPESVASKTTTTLLKNSAATNQVNSPNLQAVDSSLALANVTYGSVAAQTVEANKTRYFKVVVRLYIEGEDTQCKNDTFATLNEDWSLSLKWDLVASGSAAAKDNITNTTILVSKNAAVSATPTTVSNVNYYEVTGLTYAGKKVYIDKTSVAVSGVKFYTMDSDTAPTTATECTAFGVA